MKHISEIGDTENWPRVRSLSDPSVIELKDDYLAIELFVPEPNNGHYHIFRYMFETLDAGMRVCSEGILLARSHSPRRPSIEAWCEGHINLEVLSHIDLGTEVYKVFSPPRKSRLVSGKINDDPIIFINFDPATTTARYLNATETCFELVQEQHRRFLQEHARVS